MDEKQLLELKERINVSKSKLSELEGRKQVLMGTLKDKWSCTTITQAEVKMKTLEKDISELEEKKQKKIRKLEEDYEL